ncbi:SPOR domain-containing protein [Portibacter marinus]|uniref:SPOR domain-containing protein n=1 Tax=Portibacter marinus TaxID=2898660 RepID=UPI001F417F3A|nr:SPOR domain-containing protein [Portibacter marinus]
MNSTIKYFLTLTLLLAIFLGTSFGLESCKGKKDQSDYYEDSDDDDYSSDEEIYDEYFESTEEASRAGVEVEYPANTEMDPEFQATEKDVVDYPKEDFSFEATETEKAEINAASKKNSTTPKRSTNSSSSTTSNSGGNYFVVAGSYLIQDNASKMVDKLKNLGYGSAEVVKFDDSKYHTITAGRYNSYDEASRIASTLKQKGIDCYVHTKK